MTTNRRFSSALQALTELKADSSKPLAPALQDVLARLGTIPAEALFLGIAADGLPVLLNLHDPHPGPMLVSGDAGSGKTAFLRTIAHSVLETHRPEQVQFGVLTNYPEEWGAIAAEPHCLGVFSVGHGSAQGFLASLSAWAHSNKSTQQCRLLLADDLESVASLDLESVRDFRWLLLRGPARRVWPIVTLSAPRYGQILAWLNSFRTRFFGRIANPRVAQALGGDRRSAFDQLEAGIQFSLREKDNWLRFWLPSC